MHSGSTDAEAVESLVYTAPASPLKAHNVQKVQRRRRKRQYSSETLAAAQNLMRDRVRSYRSLLQAEADSARHCRTGHGQRQHLQQAQADDDEQSAKERIQQWLRDSGQLHQQPAPTALLNKTSGVSHGCMLAAYACMRVSTDEINGESKRT